MLAPWPSTAELALPLSTASRPTTVLPEPVASAPLPSAVADACVAVAPKPTASASVAEATGAGRAFALFVAIGMLETLVETALS